MNITNKMIATNLMVWPLSNEGEKYCMTEPPLDDKVEATWIPLPDFLNDANAMMLVIEKMRKDGLFFKCGQGILGYTVYFFSTPFTCEAEVEHESLPTAVAMAALKAKQQEAL